MANLAPRYRVRRPSTSNPLRGLLLSTAQRRTTLAASRRAFGSPRARCSSPLNRENSSYGYVPHRSRAHRDITTRGIGLPRRRGSGRATAEYPTAGSQTDPIRHLVAHDGGLLRPSRESRCDHLVFGEVAGD